MKKHPRLVVTKPVSGSPSLDNLQLALRKQLRPSAHDYIFVLWNDQFEEAVAAIFVTQLRSSGLRVKLVGLSYRPACGINGLALVPDLTLDEALLLADNTICLIVPCAWSSLKRLENDPRLREFFHRARSNQARFVIGPLNEADELHSSLVSVATDIVLVYPDCEDLVEFARRLAGALSTAS